MLHSRCLLVTHVKHSRVCLSIPNSLTISGKGHFLKAENGHEFEQTLGDGEGQGSLVCCRPWGRKESDATEQLRSSNRGAEMSGNLRSPRLGGSERDSPGPKLRMGAAGLKAAEGQADI